MKAITVEVQFDDNGEAFIELPDEMIDELGWNMDDILEWNENPDGSWTLTRREISQTSARWWLLFGAFLLGSSVGFFLWSVLGAA